MATGSIIIIIIGMLTEVVEAAYYMIIFAAK
jgi:hypothetical protein